MKKDILVSSEHEEQVWLMSWCQLNEHQYEGLNLIYKITNEGKKSVYTASAHRAEGLKAGVPDLCLPVARGGFHGLYIEMKNANGRLSSAQRRWLEELSEQGYKAIVCHSGYEAAMAIATYYREGK